MIDFLIELMVTFVIFVLFVGLIAYYVNFVGDFMHDDIKTKRDFFIWLFPYGNWIKNFIIKYKALG